MAVEHTRKLQRAYANWLMTAKGRNLAATLTFGRTLDGNQIDENVARSAIRLYSKKLNRQAFGNRAKDSRGGARLTFVAVREGNSTGEDVHLHYHAMIGIPDALSLSEWVKTCGDCWQQLKWAGKLQNTFREIYDSGWIDYILKTRTKSSFDDCVDLDTFFLKT